MPNFNKMFELDLEDIRLIETALRHAASSEREDGIDPKAAQSLLGRLHNQKIFYRPKSGVYISG
ncbi:hypothetical protein SAMN05421688_1279 [Poseidonocella pacifica]|uniref:Uncharacterized protein n=1 Tax=Poseidonocella pacifica TaxID=871651 RepID=A0A1I0WCD2_9RHOB|nr:hypothetical protein [Poseidonocella pacifica]SFA86415.1 hypothetical protein SAMN05421688_1279 [Poseidonocella pacifica]